MEHQDFKQVIFNKSNNSNKSNKSNKTETSKKISQLQTDLENVKIESDKKLGKLMSQARLAKGFNTQLEMVKEINSKTNLNISQQIYSRWESNKEAPTNEQIAKMEKVLGVKLPRNKKHSTL
jgi:ribosome-binding protein aMBF1 (putative translation factor)